MNEIKETLTKREDRALHAALQSVFLTHFPNPERQGCPGVEILQSIARKQLSIQHPAGDHVGSCSPCFKELCDIRRSLRRKRTPFPGSNVGAHLENSSGTNQVGPSHTATEKFTYTLTVKGD